MRCWSLLAALLLYLEAVHAKTVLAHFMLVNAFAYDVGDWASDIQVAQDAHINGFAINLASGIGNSSYAQRIADAFTAADASNGFKLVFSFDYAGANFSIDEIVTYLTTYASRPSYLHYQNKPVATTFEGPSAAADWISIKNQTGCFLLPAWTSVGPWKAASLAGGIADGLFSWSAWPGGPADMTTDGDLAYRNALRGKPYMMPVSPWFFANAPLFYKNWIERGDDLWFDRWNQVLAVQPEFVEIISWNDWPESHYIGPYRTKAIGHEFDAGSPYNYADGMPHDGWRATLPYWIDLYTNATPGAFPMQQEILSWWYRPSPKSACGDGGTVDMGPYFQSTFPPADCVADAIFFDAILSSPADAIVTVGGVPATATWRDKPSSGRGIYHGSVPFNVTSNATVSIQIVRDGNIVLSQLGPNISTVCQKNITNWNAWTGSTTRAEFVNVNSSSLSSSNTDLAVRSTISSINGATSSVSGATGSISGASASSSRSTTTFPPSASGRISTTITTSMLGPSVSTQRSLGSAQTITSSGLPSGGVPYSTSGSSSISILLSGSSSTSTYKITSSTNTNPASPPATPSSATGPPSRSAIESTSAQGRKSSSRITSPGRVTAPKSSAKKATVKTMARKATTKTTKRTSTTKRVKVASRIKKVKTTTDGMAEKAKHNVVHFQKSTRRHRHHTTRH